MATGPAAGTTRGDEPPRLPGISQLRQALAVAALLLMLPLLKGVAPKKGEPLLVSPPLPPTLPKPDKNPQCLHVLLTVMLMLLRFGCAESMFSFRAANERQCSQCIMKASVLMRKQHPSNTAMPDQALIQGAAQLFSIANPHTGDLNLDLLGDSNTCFYIAEML